MMKRIWMFLVGFVRMMFRHRTMIKAHDVEEIELTADGCVPASSYMVGGYDSSLKSKR